MAKLTLTASPTFKAVVLIPVPGSKPAPVEFKFNGKTKDGFKQFLESMSDMEDIDAIMEAAGGWDLEDAFNAENVAKMLQNYIGSARAILEKYINELTATARLGNSLP